MQKSEPVFKAHMMNQMSLMPQRHDKRFQLDTWLVNEAIEALDLEILPGMAFYDSALFLAFVFSFNPAFARLVTKCHL